MNLATMTKKAEENFDLGVLAGSNTKQHHCQEVANQHREWIKQHDILRGERDSLKGILP